MKKTLLVICCLFIVFSGIFCAKKTPVSIKFTSINWADNELCQYQVVIAQQVVGTYTTTIKLNKMDEVSVVEVNAVTDVKIANEQSRDIATVVFRQDNFQPISATREITSQGAKYSSIIKYSKDKALIKISTPAGEKSVDVPITANHFDNDEVTTLLRAVDLKQDENKEISVVTGLGGTAIPVKIKSLGLEKITVPAGEFECNKYEMNLVNRTVELWYEKAGARRMIKYFDVASDMAMHLMP